MTKETGKYRDRASGESSADYGQRAAYELEAELLQTNLGNVATACERERDEP